ncbi:mechanosensitive ion channel family protein [Methanococcoides methylutens]|uniref:mechanosensitive ion channel family protein n=1 Tax=Methanococcoides methylutens TaxID=2226 RepID=UPI0040450BA6
MVESPILDSLFGMLDQVIAFIPTLVAIIVLLIVGMVVGKALGKIGSKVLDKIGLDDLIDKTSLGGMIAKTGTTTVEMFDALIKWFIYIIFAVIIIDLLDIQVVADFITQVILFLPLIVSAGLTLIIGVLIVDFLADLVKTVGIASGIDEKIGKSGIGKGLEAAELKTSGIIAGIVKAFGYIIFILAASNILGLDVVSNFLVNVLNYIPNLFAGILILIVGLLAIDFLTDYLKGILEGMDVEGANIWIPLLRGFLALVLILLALDAMLIDTSIFYLLIGPLAWGIAVVVAFKWGIKEALVAYAREKK